MSNNLNITQVATNQDNKEATINDQAGELDAAFTEVLTSDYTSGNITLTDSEFRRNVGFKASNLSVARQLTTPATIKRFFFVDNTDGTDTLTVTDGTASTVLVSGEVASFLHSGSAGGLSLVSNSNAAPFDLGTFWVGAPGSSELLLAFLFTRSVTFEDDFSGSQFDNGTNPTSAVVIDIAKNGTDIGHIDVTTGGVGSFTTDATTASFVAGDLLTVTAPASADATMADLRITLLGSRGT